MNLTTLLGYATSFFLSGVAQRDYVGLIGQNVSNGLHMFQWGTVAVFVVPDAQGGYAYKWENLTEIGVINGKLPMCVPECGFDNELCSSFKDKLSSVQMLLLVSGLVALLVFIGLTWNYKRRSNYERRLESGYFLVNRGEVMLHNISNYGSSRAGSMMQSAMSLKSFTGGNMDEIGTMQFYERGIRRVIERRRKNKRSPTPLPPSRNNEWQEIEDWHLAKFDTSLVTVRKINKTSLELTRAVREEVDNLMLGQDENLNRFFGLINENDMIFTIHEFGARSCLNDILRNTDINLDRMFTVSFIGNIVNGLKYLHNESKIGYHGNLKSTNCVVDSYWRVKLSNFGMEQMRQDEPEPKPKEMLWSAPELIRRFCVKSDLSKIELARADIYSLAIVLYEIYGREGPYGDDFIDSSGKNKTFHQNKKNSEIVAQIKYPSGETYFRPDLHLISKAPKVLLQTVESCWSENPLERPSIKKVIGMIKSLSKGNIADNISKILDRYKFSLEDMINERVADLEEEKERNENLLLQLLPKTVAASLKYGKPVKAESYDSVTIYFSDIVGFTALSSKSTPLQIVEMLNDLYTTFDMIIDKFDCYKVETIGDAYMFVSGLPETNGYIHVGEVAGASLELLESIKTFVVPHCPEERLRLRIGIHSGPAVTGVVGIKMPRFCLFGDTVVIANAMESKGEPMRIQISKASYELLVKCKGYEVEPRGKIVMKNGKEVDTFWLNSYSKEARLATIRKNRELFPHLDQFLRR